MGFELTPAFWSGLGQIILVNIVLSGDNALVIALACRNLEKRTRNPPSWSAAPAPSSCASSSC